MIAKLWNRWCPQRTWREVVRLTVIESLVSVVLIEMLNALFF